MSTKHAPAPWSVYQYGTRPMVIDSGRDAVCECFTFPNRERGEADATLIAAAPDLLAALEEFARFADAYDAERRPGQPFFPDDHTVYAMHLGSGDYEITAGMLRAARAAIAKATAGSTP